MSATIFSLGGGAFRRKETRRKSNACLVFARQMLKTSWQLQKENKLNCIACHCGFSATHTVRLRGSAVNPQHDCRAFEEKSVLNSGPKAKRAAPDTLSRISNHTSHARGESDAGANSMRHTGAVPPLSYVLLSPTSTGAQEIDETCFEGENASVNENTAEQNRAEQMSRGQKQVILGWNAIYVATERRTPRATAIAIRGTCFPLPEGSTLEERPRESRKERTVLVEKVQGVATSADAESYMHSNEEQPQNGAMRHAKAIIPFEVGGRR
ncbi:hypothetical protein C8R45DRAFT_1180957 [Mycena sanguinolenta]|nr:hypothetical protein C8R45DRAFT_1180957 [Mycena sanguinolenta]